MIDFENFTLDNGLRVILHQDKGTPLAAVNILYNVGAKHENPERTGFAHLFEHLMFGGSANIPSYDKPLEIAGGENNAFTNNDYTNYYLNLPADNLETAFWLESDRMLELDFSPKSLEVQRKVVIEEYKQRYLNQPYGDAWLLLRPLVYKNHPYQWPTIGKHIAHIETATLQDVKNFFYTYYGPDNAILSVCGNIDFAKTRALINKWFAPIPSRKIKVPLLNPEPSQTEARKEIVTRKVPADMIYKIYRFEGRTSDSFYPTDLLSDVLSNGKSSRLYQRLVKEKQIFSDIDAYIYPELDGGMFVFNGKPMKGITLEEAEKYIIEEIDQVCHHNADEYEVQKVKNKFESTTLMSYTSIVQKAMMLGFYHLLGDTNSINTELARYMEVSSNDIRNQATRIFRPENCSTLFYYSDTKN